jgi:hypothetical protein
MTRTGLHAGAVGAVALLLLSGCMDPFRPVVDPAVLHHDLNWVEQPFAQEGGGWLGPAGRVETDYKFNPPGDGPPFPGLLQVFGLYEHKTADQLLSFARTLVANATESLNIQVESSTYHQGTRTIRNDLVTQFFSEEGTVTSAGVVFPSNVKVRIVAEAGYDGKSSTSVVAIGIAQVASSTECPVIGPCQGTNDLVTWTSMVGDARGSITGSVSSFGLLDHLVTHG